MHLNTSLKRHLSARQNRKFRERAWTFELPPTLLMAVGQQERYLNFKTIKRLGYIFATWRTRPTNFITDQTKTYFVSIIKEVPWKDFNNSKNLTILKLYGTCDNRADNVELRKKLWPLTMMCMKLPLWCQLLSFQLLSKLKL